MPVSKHRKGFKKRKAEAKEKALIAKNRQKAKFVEVVNNMNAQQAMLGDTEVVKQINEEEEGGN